MANFFFLESDDFTRSNEDIDEEKDEQEEHNKDEEEEHDTPRMVNFTGSNEDRDEGDGNRMRKT